MLLNAYYLKESKGFAILSVITLEILLIHNQMNKRIFLMY